MAPRWAEQSLAQVPWEYTIVLSGEVNRWGHERAWEHGATTRSFISSCIAVMEVALLGPRSFHCWPFDSKGCGRYRGRPVPISCPSTLSKSERILRSPNSDLLKRDGLSCSEDYQWQVQPFLSPEDLPTCDWTRPLHCSWSLNGWAPGEASHLLSHLLGLNLIPSDQGFCILLSLEAFFQNPRAIDSKSILLFILGRLKWHLRTP